MNLREDISQLKTDTATLRKFGLLVGGVFSFLGLVWLLRDKPYFPYALIPGYALVVLGIEFPRALRSIYIAWMSVAFVLGFVMAHVILTLFFYLVITPVGLLARVAGKDFLSLKLDHSAKSYWLPRERRTRKPEDYERQF